MKHVRMLIPMLVVLGAMPVHAAVQSEIEVEREYLRADKKELVSQAMMLDAATATKFWPLYNEYQEALRPLGDRRVKLIMEFAAQYREMNDAQAKVLLDDHIKIQDDIQAAQKKYVAKFRKSFPETIVARYFQVENKINAIINIGLAKNIPLVQLP